MRRWAVRMRSKKERGDAISRAASSYKEGIRAINERIEFLATKRGYRRFVNEGTAEEMVTEILEWVFEEQHKRNMKRIV